MGLTVLLNCSTSLNGKTASTLRHAGTVLAASGATVESIAVRDSVSAAKDAVSRADGIVLATPVMAGTFSGLTKSLLDECAASRYSGKNTFEGKPVLLIGVAGGLAHYQVLGDLARVMLGFFAAYLVPPGLYVCPSVADDDLQRLLILECTALAELQETVASVPALQAVEPQL